MQDQLSRRNFLQVATITAAGMLLPKTSYTDTEFQSDENQGRVIEGSSTIFTIPSFNGTKIETYWKDTVFPITGATIGDLTPAFNRVWYKAGDLGYVHSGNIQPVRTILQEPEHDIPEGGRLGEVTVPFTDAHWGASTQNAVAYRFYYETTYWVTGLIEGTDGTPWYKVIDDKWEYLLYVPATHMRLVPYEELSPLSAELSDSEKRIEILSDQQIIIAYESDKPVFMAKTATGAVFSNGNFSTPRGFHHIFHKRPSRHMAAGNLAANGYDLPGVPWVTYFTESGISFHGTFWHNNYGRPRSHGCVNLSPKAAKWVFRWSNPVIDPTHDFVYKDTGTLVTVL